MYYVKTEVADVRHFIGTSCSIPNKGEYFSVVYILEGSGHAILNNEILSVTKDEIITLLPDECIGIKSEKGKESFIIQIMFRVFSKKMINDIKNSPYKQNTSGKITRTIVLKILSEYVLKPPLHQYFINMYLAELLLEIVTENNENSDEQSLNWQTQLAGSINSDLRRMIEYIDKNTSDTITVETLADLIHTTPGTVYKLFKLWLNTTPIQYLNTVRLNKAKELLLYTDLSITEISEQVGFNTIHYFSRYFREKEKISPSDFKEKYIGKNPTLS